MCLFKQLVDFNVNLAFPRTAAVKDNKFKAQQILQ